MTNTFEIKKIQFAEECKTINLKFEYENYTGKERYAIITDISEDELVEKYGDILKCFYSPYLLLSVEQGAAIIEYQNIEAKHRMRQLRHGHAFDINDGDFDEHHPEIAVDDNIIELLCMQEEKQRIKKAIDALTEIQKRRVIAYFFEGKSYRKIASEEGVNHSKIEKSISLALKKLKILLSDGVQNAPFSSSK